MQPALMREIYIHSGHQVRGFNIVGEYKDVIPESQIYNDNATTDLVCVDHYFTKSYEEWLEKLRRGSGDYNYSRRYKEFFRHNPDMEYCREESFPQQQYETSDKKVINKQ